MYSLSPILFIIFLSIIITLSQHVIRGEKTRYSICCPIPDAIWFGPNNQSILTNSNKYNIKHFSDNVQLTIHHLILDDEGEYICQNNQTDRIIKRYRIKIGRLKNVLFLFFIVSISILIFIPIFWYFGKKYSGINQ